MSEKNNNDTRRRQDTTNLLVWDPIAPKMSKKQANYATNVQPVQRQIPVKERGRNILEYREFGEMGEEDKKTFLQNTRRAFPNRHSHGNIISGDFVQDNTKTERRRFLRHKDHPSILKWETDNDQTNIAKKESPYRPIDHNIFDPQEKDSIRLHHYRRVKGTESNGYITGIEPTEAYAPGYINPTDRFSKQEIDQLLKNEQNKRKMIKNDYLRLKREGRERAENHYHDCDLSFEIKEQEQTNLRRQTTRVNAPSVAYDIISLNDSNTLNEELLKLRKDEEIAKQNATQRTRLLARRDESDNNPLKINFQLNPED